MLINIIIYTDLFENLIKLLIKQCTIDLTIKIYIWDLNFESTIIIILKY